MLPPLRLCSLGAILLLGSCGPRPGPQPSLGTLHQPLVHSFDLAQNMPPHLAIAFVMAWFGLPASEPTNPAPDPFWGNWSWNTDDCGGLHSAPGSCSTTPTGDWQRSIASRYRPLAGIYSSSGLTDESLRRMDLMLASLRRSCDEGSRIDAYAIQLSGTYGTSLHPAHPQSNVANINLEAFRNMMARADAAGLQNVVMGATDVTWYWHWGTSVGLDCAADKQACLDAVSQDMVDMLAILGPHPSALRIGAKPIFLFYVDSTYTTAADWAAILAKARADSGQDFYTLGTHTGADGSGMFDAFDALAPWLEFYWWDASSGADIRTRSKNYAQGLHNAVSNAVGAKPGRVEFFGVAPGFDDFTEDWGACTERQVPRAGQGLGARDPAFLDGQFDWAVQEQLKGVLVETWDDFTEGTLVEPDVGHGTATLMHLRHRLGDLFGEPADAAADARLDSRWTGYGQSRACNGATGIHTGPGPQLDPSCSAASGSIEGHVRNASNATPVTGATLSWGGGGPATSDATGFYQLAHVADGTWAVTAAATGYIERSISVTVSGSATVTRDFQLATGGILSGTVRDSATGTGIAGASATVSGGVVPNTLAVTADGSGGYTTSWIAVGVYDLTCAASGYAARTVPGVNVATGLTTTQDCVLDRVPVATDAGEEPDASPIPADAASALPDAAVPPADAGAGVAPDSGAGTRASGSGCGCGQPGTTAMGLSLLLAAAFGLAARRVAMR